MIRFLSGFVIGMVAAICAWMSLSMIVPFTERGLDRAHNSHMRLFLHDLQEFHTGHHDTDTAYISFSISTAINDPEDYFARIDTAIKDTEWRQLEAHKTYRLFVSPWKQTPAGDERTEVTITFQPKAQKVIYTQERQYDLSGL